MLETVLAEPRIRRPSQESGRQGVRAFIGIAGIGSQNLATGVGLRTELSPALGSRPLDTGGKRRRFEAPERLPKAPGEAAPTQLDFEVAVETGLGASTVASFATSTHGTAPVLPEALIGGVGSAKLQEFLAEEVTRFASLKQMAAEATMPFARLREALAEAARPTMALRELLAEDTARFVTLKQALAAEAATISLTWREALAEAARPTMAWRELLAEGTARFVTLKQATAAEATTVSLTLREALAEATRPAVTIREPLFNQTASAVEGTRPLDLIFPLEVRDYAVAHGLTASLQKVSELIVQTMPGAEALAVVLKTDPEDVNYRVMCFEISIRGSADEVFALEERLLDGLVDQVPSTDRRHFCFSYQFR